MDHKATWAALALLSVSTLSAQDQKAKYWNEFKQNITVGGYVIGKASATDRDLDATTKSHTDFDLRLVRVYAGGKMLDFKYNFQMEMNGVSGASKEKGPHIVDAWIEWCKYKYVNVKFGQFKRAFTFENPMNPWDIGMGAYSQLIDKLAGMNDRVGEHTSGGRDLGLQLQGDFFTSKRDGHSFLHYQMGVYNGQGINHADENRAKDVIGGLWVMPVKELAIGAFGWGGNYTKNGITVDRNRFACGVKYESKWTVRAEYALSQGHKISDYKIDEQTGQESFTGRDKSDAWYVVVGAPAGKHCKIYAHWDVYRDDRTHATQRSLYGASANYYFCKNLKLQANYNFTDDRATGGDGHYNTFDMQLYWRF
ncbi:MAG: OprO/OprP family phosphate-selective porin [Clostridium sp.]|nr:OprO/OprP family phosphate-selective porin [Clostridium sp.]